MKGCKTIAEYAIKKWMENEGFFVGEFAVKMNGDEATITDVTGNSIIVRYDRRTRIVKEVEM